MFSGTSPDVRDELIEVVINGRSGPKTRLTIHVGSGSSEHPLEGHFVNSMVFLFSQVLHPTCESLLLQLLSVASRFQESDCSNL